MKTRTTTRSAVLGACLTTVGLASTALATPATAGRPDRPTVELACGAVVTSSVRLGADITGCAGPALVVGAPGITIDLNGKTLSGSGVLPGIDDNGGHDDLTIEGGTIRGFGQGIDLVESHRTRVRDVRLVENGVGVVLSRGDDVRIERVTAVDNSFLGIEAFATERLLVRDSRVTGGDFGGIQDRATYDSRYVRNVVRGNEFFGLLIDWATGTVATGNVAVGNAYTGIRVGSLNEGVRLHGNIALRNGAEGIAVEEAGVRLARNVAAYNRGAGIAAVEGTVDLGGNRAFANGGDDCTGVSCR